MDILAQLQARLARVVPRGRDERIRWAARGLGIALGALWGPALGIAIAIVLFCSAGHDDSHITLWAAYALAEFGEIVNHSGVRVEQSSSLLHTLVLALAHTLTGVRLPWLGYLMGIAFAVLTVIRLPQLGKLGGNSNAFRLAAGTLPVLTYWALAGLETTLFCWVSVEFLIACARMLEPPGVERRAWTGPALWSLAFAMTRPEASIVALCALAAIVPFAWWRGRRCGLRAVGLVVLNLVVFWMLMRWRLHYFGEAWPHPVAAKIATAEGDFEWQLWMGIRQVFNLFLAADAAPLLGGLVLGVFGLVRDLRERDVKRPLITAFGGAYVAFIACSGGDWMFGGRFLAHIAPVLMLLLFVELDVASWPRRRAWMLAVAITVANVWQGVAFSARESMGRPIWVTWQVLPTIEANAGARDFTWVELTNKPHGRDAIFLKELDPVIDRLVASEGKISILSVQAGMVMYYLAQRHYGKIEFVDQAGLVSRHYDPLVEELEIPHARLGLAWSLADSLAIGEFREGPEFHPDVVFDLYTGARNAARRNGYVVIFEQDGSFLSSYTPEEEEPEEEEEVDEDAQEQPTVYRTPEEAVVERLRDKFARKRDGREINFFTAKKGFFQFIAVDPDLAEKVGWARREYDEQGRPRARMRVRFKRWKWAEIRTQYMRYFEDEPDFSDFGGETKAKPKSKAKTKKAKTKVKGKASAPASGEDSTDGEDEDEDEDVDDDTGELGEDEGEDEPPEDDPDEFEQNRDEAD